MTNYYLAEGDQRRGPFTIEELKQKHVTHEDMIWRRGLEQWVPARDLPELAEILEPEPPPLPFEHRAASAATQSDSIGTVSGDRSAPTHDGLGGTAAPAPTCSLADWCLIPIIVVLNKVVLFGALFSGWLIYSWARQIPQYSHAVRDAIFGGLLFIGGSGAALMSVEAARWACAKLSRQQSAPRWLSVFASAVMAAVAIALFAALLGLALFEMGRMVPRRPSAPAVLNEAPRADVRF